MAPPRAGTPSDRLPPQSPVALRGVDAAKAALGRRRRLRIGYARHQRRRFGHIALLLRSSRESRTTTSASPSTSSRRAAAISHANGMARNAVDDAIALSGAGLPRGHATFLSRPSTRWPRRSRPPRRLATEAGSAPSPPSRICRARGIHWPISWCGAAAEAEITNAERAALVCSTELDPRAAIWEEEERSTLRVHRHLVGDGPVLARRRKAMIVRLARAARRLAGAGLRGARARGGREGAEVVVPSSARAATNEGRRSCWRRRATPTRRRPVARRSRRRWRR